MRKILFIFVLSALIFVIYGCRPSLSNELYSCVEYLERFKLRGYNEYYFVEVTVGQASEADFCKIVLIPTNLYSDTDNLRYKYGKHKGGFEKDTNTDQYVAVMEYDKVHNEFTLESKNGKEKIELFALTAEFPAKELLLQAYTHFEDILYKEVKNKKNRHKVYMKILADMSGNAFYYIGFVSNNDFLAVIYNIDTLELIADYVK